MLPPRERHSISHAVSHILISLTATLVLLGASVARGEFPCQYQEVMIPMRDGVRLQTVILIPIHKKQPLPILLQRTPYGVPEKAPETIPPSFQELSDDGYVFVFQNLRGRFKSEGVFALSSQVDLNDPKAVNETTDAYDTIDWLVKNVSSNGRVGISSHSLAADRTG